MKSNRFIVSAVLAGVSTWLLSNYFQGVSQQRRQLARKKMSKAAVQDWEGEGGSIIDVVPRAVTS